MRLLIDQLDVAPMLNVVEQSSRSSILFAVGQLFDLTQYLFKQLGHYFDLASFDRSTLAYVGAFSARTYFANGIR